MFLNLYWQDVYNSITNIPKNDGDKYDHIVKITWKQQKDNYSQANFVDSIRKLAK